MCNVNIEHKNYIHIRSGGGDEATLDTIYHFDDEKSKELLHLMMEMLRGAFENRV